MSKIGQDTKKLQKIGNDIIVTSFLNNPAIFVCDYFLLIPIDVPSFKLIEGQIKELQGVVPNTPGAENDQKSPGRIGLSLEKIFKKLKKKLLDSTNFLFGELKKTFIF